MDPEKVRAVLDWPRPDTRKQLQRFLGFTNFYRRFIRNYSHTAAPLTALTSPARPFHWSSEAEGAFWISRRGLRQLPFSLTLTRPGSLLWRWTPRMWEWGQSCPSGHQRITNFILVPFYPIVYLPQKETMMSGTGNCWP